MPRVFISYIRENSKDVIRLVNALKAHQVEVWFDQTHLQPGDRWADVIRREIAQGDFFIACFSTEFSKRRKTFMHEEITQAIEQLRQRPTAQPWFIPVLLSDCEIPDRSIGAGETLRSIQWVALYDDWEEGIRRILAVLQCPAQSADQVKLKVYYPGRFFPFGEAKLEVFFDGQLIGFGFLKKGIDLVVDTITGEHVLEVKGYLTRNRFNLEFPSSGNYLVNLTYIDKGIRKIFNAAPIYVGNLQP